MSFVLNIHCGRFLRSEGIRFELSAKWKKFKTIALLMALVAGPVSLAKEPLTDKAAIESAREELGGYGGFPWYDDERDALKRLDVKPPADASGRKSKWEYRPVTFSWPRWLAQLLEAFGWLILVLAILMVVLALVRAFGITDFSASGLDRDSEDSLRGDIDRVEALPFQLQRPQSDLLAEARRHYEAGDYNQAIIYLYSYQLVQLDRHHLIRLTKGKTNRQYLREVRPNLVLWEILRSSMIAFEEVFFGRHQLHRDGFENNWNRVEDFHRLLDGVPV